MEVAASFLTIWQHYHHQYSVLKTTNELHLHEIYKDEKYFQQEVKLKGHLHKDSVDLERAQHYEKMSHDLEFDRRESIRDIWRQRAEVSQSLMVVDTLMFASAFSLLLEGKIPLASPALLVQVYAFSIGVSLALLLISMWFILLLQTLMSRYDIHHPFMTYYPCGKSHPSFSSYYVCHCKHISRHSESAYYAGTLAFLVASGLLLSAKFLYDYNNEIAVPLFSIVMFTFAMIVPVGRFIWPNQTRPHEKVIRRQIAETDWAPDPAALRTEERGQEEEAGP